MRTNQGTDFHYSMFYSCLCLFNSLIYPTGRKNLLEFSINIFLIEHSLHFNSAYNSIFRNLLMKFVNQTSLIYDFDHFQLVGYFLEFERIILNLVLFVRRSTWKSQLYFMLYKANNHATSTHSMYNDSPLYILPSLLILILACTFAASPQPWTSGIPCVKQNLEAEKPLVIVIDRRGLGESFTYLQHFINL